MKNLLFVLAALLLGLACIAVPDHSDRIVCLATLGILSLYFFGITIRDYLNIISKDKKSKPSHTTELFIHGQELNIRS